MNQLKRFVFHPLVICLLFCFLLISGESTGYFYIILLMFGLPHGALHSCLGVLGIAFLLCSLAAKGGKATSTFNLLGAACMLVSLVLFFTQPGGSYNDNTFREAVPLTVFLIFSVVLLLFIFYQVRIFFLKEAHSRK